MSASEGNEEILQDTAGLSIVVPFFNSLGVFPRLYNSILNQAPSGLSTELIVVDDCSDDPQKISDYMAMRPEIRFFRMERNGGPLKARLEGASKARFSHILFFDADDELAPDFFSSVAKAIAQDYSFILFDSLKDDGSVVSPCESEGQVPEREAVSSLFINGRAGYSSCKIFAKRLLSEESYRLPRMMYLEDSALTVTLYSKARHDAFYIKKQLAFWHDTPGSLSKNFNKDFLKYVLLLAESRETLIRTEFDGEEEKRYTDELIRWFASSLYVVFSGLCYSKKADLVKEEFAYIRVSPVFQRLLMNSKPRGLPLNAFFCLFCLKRNAPGLFVTGWKIQRALKNRNRG